MKSNLSQIDILSFDNFTNFDFSIPNISEHELDIEELDMVIEMFQNDQNTLSEPMLSVIIVFYSVLMVLAGMNKSWFLAFFKITKEKISHVLES